LDQSTPATGTIHFTDVDLTDLPAAKITGQSVTWLDTDGTTHLTLTGQDTALEQALTLQQTGKNNGTVGWTYSVADSALDFLGENQTATVVSTITIEDSHHKTSTAQVTVTITGANDAPTLAEVTKGPLVDTAVADSFSDLTGKLVGTDADSGETATLTYAVLDATNHAATTVAGHYGSLTVNSDGTYSYVADAAAINALSAGNYADTFTVQTKDAHNAVGTASFTVNVTGANDTPTLSNGSIGKLTDTAATDSFTDLTGHLTGTDADSGDTLTYAVLNADHHAATTAGGLYGSLTVNTDGTYSYVPDAASINALPEGSYSDTFTVQVTDAHGAATTATYTVDLTGANDMPKLSDVNIGTLTDTAATDTFSDLTGKLAGTDADTGETATLTYAVLDATHHAAATVAGHYGSLTVNANGNYSYVPNATAINALPEGSYSDTFTVQTTDIHGAAGTATLTVGVTGANDTPMFNLDHVSVRQDDDERVAVHGLSFTDPDAAQNEMFTLAATTEAAGSNVSPSTRSGLFATINASLNTVIYNEGSAEPPTDKITLTVTDGHGASDTIHLVFNLPESANDHARITGTTGKDLFIGTGYQDQFVFAANSNHDTIVNFTPGQDHIDLSAVVTTSNVSGWLAQHVAASPTNSADTLITIDPADTIVLKGVGVASLHASDFIVHA
jgi:VCBS repeat-containing protein